MTTPRTLVLAIGRWLELLSRTSFVRANAIVHNDAAYTDITPTQYASAFEWISNVKDLSALVELARQSGARKVPLDLSRRVALENLIREEHPSWLAVADQLVISADDLPSDVASLSRSLGMTDKECLDAVRNVSGRIDPEARTKFGAAGEAALVAMLDAAWPGSVTHISTITDGMGYDIAFQVLGVEWHLEVKSVTSASRKRIFLSRNEYEVSRRDEYWRLVLVVLDEELLAHSVSVLDSSLLWTRSPRDVTTRAAWETCKFVLKPGEARSPFCAALGIDAPKHAHAALVGTGIDA